MSNVTDNPPSTEHIGLSGERENRLLEVGSALSSTASVTGCGDLDSPVSFGVHPGFGPPLGGPGCGGHSWQYLGRSQTLHPKCEQPNRLGCTKCGEQLIVRCGSSRASRCQPCGESHRRRLMQIVESGTTGDRFGQYWWVTITAPGEDDLPWDEAECSHGPEVECSGKLGCQVEWWSAAAWNGQAPKRWSWFMTYVRRRLGDQVQYCGTWEWQSRGVLHRHFLMRSERPTTERRVRAAVRGAARRWGFGSQYDVRSIAGGAAREIAYVAKYASKTVDSIDGRRVLDVRTGELKCSRGFRAWSASRSWGDTMRVVKARQCAYARASGQPVASASAAAAGAAGVGLDDNSKSSTLDGVGVVGAFVVDSPAAIL